MDNMMSVSRKKLQSLCVRWDNEKNKYFYPKSIAKERGPCATILCIILIVIIILVDLFTTNLSKLTVGYRYAAVFIYYFLLHILYRCTLMLEEISHLKSRYEGSFRSILNDGLYFQAPVLISLVISFLYVVYYHNNDTVNHFDYRVIFVSTATYLICTVVHLESCPLNDSLWVSSKNGLNYGSGMAYSFFHGYLKLVLPQTGTEEKNLEELMRDYEDQNGIKFSAYKLFILIPKSLHCTVSLKNDSSPSVDESCSLSEKLKTVAGVKDRSYKNAVYKIIDSKKKKHYMSAEYATPLKTFEDVLSDTRIEHSGYYEKHKKDIILQFFLTLTTILERHGLSESCELIFYEDSYQGEDNKICYYDVGRILLTRFEQINNRKKND